MNKSRYSETLLHYFYHLEHAGSLVGDHVYAAEQGNAAQGSHIKLYIALEDVMISQARFKCYGSVISLAVCEFVCRWLEGKTVQQLAQLDTQLILQALELTEIHQHVALRLVACVNHLLRSLS